MSLSHILARYSIYVISGGHVRTWQPEDIMMNAGALMLHNLTRAEWAQFIGDAVPYQAVCDNLLLEPEAGLIPTVTP